MIIGVLSVIGAISIAVAVVSVIAYFIDEHEKLDRCSWRIDRQIEDITELFKIVNELREKQEKNDADAETCKAGRS